MRRKSIYLACCVLAAVLDGQGSERRRVGEGSQLGHLTIQEIRAGSIMYWKQNPEQAGEMSVKHQPLLTSLGRRYIPELAHSASSGVVASGAHVAGEGTSPCFPIVLSSTLRGPTGSRRSF